MMGSELVTAVIDVGGVVAVASVAAAGDNERTLLLLPDSCTDRDRNEYPTWWW